LRRLNTQSISEAYKWYEEFPWSKAWSSWYEEDSPTTSLCPIHKKSPIVFVAGYVYIYPDGETYTMAAGWVCLSCLLQASTSDKIFYDSKGNIDTSRTDRVSIRKITPKEYVEKTKNYKIILRED